MERISSLPDSADGAGIKDSLKIRIILLTNVHLHLPVSQPTVKPSPVYPFDFAHIDRPERHLQNTKSHQAKSDE